MPLLVFSQSIFNFAFAQATGVFPAGHAQALADAYLTMIHPKRKKLFLIALLLFGFVLSIFFTVIDRHAYYKSPNGEYSLSVYRVPFPISAIGGSSDAPGVIILSNKFGIPIKACGVDMVQSMSSPKWIDNRVYVKLILDWKLE